MELLYNEMIKNDALIDMTSELKRHTKNKKLVNELVKESFTIFYQRYITFHFTADDKFYTDDIINLFDNQLELIMYLIPIFHMLGDTLGYKNGEWEFNMGINPKDVTSSLASEFVFEFLSLGGINDISLLNWRYSDDSLMYLATLEVANDHSSESSTIDEFGQALKLKYLEIFPDLETRHPGTTTRESLFMLRDGVAWNGINYNSMAIGSGTSMRTGGLGIIFCGERNRLRLISSSIEASRITHNSAVAMLGGVTSALFTAFAIEQIAVNLWPHYLVEFIREDMIDNYLKESRPNEYASYQRDRVIFLGKWEKYITLRFNGRDKKKDQKMMQNPISRIQFLSDNFSRTEKSYFPGACADDSVIIAYDALLESDGSLEKVIINSVLHPGDSDTTGCIALGWFIASFFSLKNTSIAYRMIVELERIEHWSDTLKKIMKKQLPIIRNELLIETFLIKTNEEEVSISYNQWKK